MVKIKWVPRSIEPKLHSLIQKEKSILLLGPRQTGKTSLLERFKFDIEILLLSPRQRLRYEKEPDLLADEVEAYIQKNKKTPLILIDEIQKVPALLDVIQWLSDHKKASFWLTGSSARKLKFHAREINLLPGRIRLFRLDPLSLLELSKVSLNELLLFGSLPGVILNPDKQDRSEVLTTYVETYLEEEVRKEALVRQLDQFMRFLELAAIDSGKITNYSKISQQLGIAHTTIASHYQILEDCLIVERIDPITKSLTRKKLTHAPRFLFFDLGVRRFAAGEGEKLNPERMGELFEQWVGLELVRASRFRLHSKLRFWRDPDGPEIDWVFEHEKRWIPFEVKWVEKPTSKAIHHLEVFIHEYPSFASKGYVVCRTPRRYRLSSKIEALPWQELHDVLPV